MSQRGEEENLLLPPAEEYEELLHGLFPRQYPRPAVAIDTSTVRRYTDLDAPRTRTPTAPPRPTVEQTMARERERQCRQMHAQIWNSGPLNLDQDIRNANVSG